jgi:two-component system cell cycle response regulator
MRHKILTVDDSRTVRLILKKTFKPFDCEIFEATNGVEGLAVAAKVQPALILLDVTMPVMDGVEMLTLLKANPQLKNIPVVMLTAEGGRDKVLDIAKLGVRGYIVKPFKDEAIIEKVGRIIELKPGTDGPAKARSILDPIEIMVVEDKPAIVQQIRDGLKNTSWKIQGVAGRSEAVDACALTAPDVVVVSLSLPDGGAFALFRTLRSNMRTKFTPIIALVVKTDAAGQAQAQEMGFTAIVTKPIDPAELDSRLISVMNLDTSARYFRTQGEVLVVTLPANCTSSVLADVTQHLGSMLSGAVDAGLSRVVIDIHAVASLHMGIIKILVEAMQSCQILAMQIAIVGNARLITECRAFEETRNWCFYESIDDARAHLSGTPSPPSGQLVET